jgi:hypothetical protein
VTVRWPGVPRFARCRQRLVSAKDSTPRPAGVAAAVFSPNSHVIPQVGARRVKGLTDDEVPVHSGAARAVKLTSTFSKPLWRSVFGVGRVGAFVGGSEVDVIGG